MNKFICKIALEIESEEGLSIEEIQEMVTRGAFNDKLKVYELRLVRPEVGEK